MTRSLPEPLVADSPQVVRALDILAALLPAPTRSLAELAGPWWQEASEEERAAVVSSVHQLIVNRLGKPRGPRGSVPEQEGEADVPLVERLRFCWTLLKKGDEAVRARRRTKEPPASAKVFARVLGPSSPAPPPALLSSLCAMLDVGENGGLLSYYADFLRGEEGPTSLPLLDSGGRPQLGQVRRLLWWLVRNEQEAYVRERPPRVDRGRLVECVRGRFVRLVPAEAAALPELPGLIDEQVERWLAYSCLSGAGRPAGEKEFGELVRTYRSCNKLKQPPAGRAAGQEAERLRAENDELRAENRRLREAAVPESAPPRDEEELTRLRGEVARLEAELAQVRSKQETAWVPAEFRELQGFLRLIEEKYPLDTLHQVQMGAEVPITLRQFVSHFLYGLRKRGLSQYPDAAEFDLAYDDSGLYDCQGFEVSPGATVRVSVIKKGWALRNGRSLISLRKARVRLAAADRCEAAP
jgi:hypothetical protein